MSEIERAIEYFERKIVKNDRACENYVAPFAEEAKRQWIEIDRPIGELALKLLRAELSRQENAPLTWDELVSMIRKTVYIVDRTDDEKSGWAIVGKQHIKIGLEFITLCENLAFRRELKELYGQTWLAYRYEPKGANQ